MRFPKRWSPRSMFKPIEDRRIVLPRIKFSVMRKISFTGNQIRMAVAVHISHPHGMSLGKSLTDLVCLPGRGRGGGAGTSSFPSVNLFVPPNTVTVCRGTDHVLVTVSIHIHGVHL